MKKRSLAVVALVLALGAAGRAQAQEHSPSHVAAALEMLEAAQVSQSIESSINTMLQVQMSAQPMLRSVEGVMRDFLKRHMSWDALKNDYAHIYAAEFTEAELREMAAFYRTPTGRKMAAAQPRLMQAGAELGQRKVQEHMGELQQAIMQHLQQQGGAGSTPQP